MIDKNGIILYNIGNYTAVPQKENDIMYTPKPMDTKGIELDGEMLALMENLAENVHEVWAQGRIADGWKYGEERSDRERTTPCLVPYGSLSEEEKEYDRKTAAETIKFIMAMGYKIHK